MPEHFSDKAKDLIKRIFQPNPIDRIKFHEIKLHPWIFEDIPCTIEMFGFQKVIL